MSFFIFKNFLRIYVISIFLSEGKLSEESQMAAQGSHKAVPFSFPRGRRRALLARAPPQAGRCKPALTPKEDQA